jgi:hypothetical protein
MAIRSFLAAALVALAAAPAASAAAAPCDSTCLEHLTDAYLDAMVAKAPARLPWAKVVGYSENGVHMMVGDALWATITAHGAPVLRASDPAAGEAAWLGMVEEHGQPAFLALRLKAVDGRISQVETIVRRKGGPAPFGDPQAWTADEAFARPAPASRKALLAAMDRLAPACVRVDNGVRAPACAPSGKVRARRTPLADAARGVVLATGFFDHPARDLSGPTRYPESLGWIGLYKVRDGRVVRIEDVMTDLPYLMPAPFGG